MGKQVPTFNVGVNMCVTSSTIYDSQKVEAAQVSTDGQMDKTMWPLHVIESYSA